MNHKHHTRIAITACDTELGCEVARYLASKLVHKCKHVLFVCLARNIEHIDDRLKHQKNVKIEKIDYDKGDSLKHALHKVKLAIIIPELDDQRVDHAKCLIQCMHTQGVEHSILLSSIGAESDMPELRKFGEMEKALKDMVDSYHILRLAFANQYFFYWHSIIKEKAEFPMSVDKDSQMVPVDLDDVAKSIGKLVVEHCKDHKDHKLDDHKGHSSCSHTDSVLGYESAISGRDNNKDKRETYTLTGPKELTAEQVVQTLNEITQANAVFKAVSRDDVKKYLDSLEQHPSRTANDKDPATPAGGHHHHHHHHHHHYHHKMVPNKTMIAILLDELELIKKGEAGKKTNDLEELIGDHAHSTRDFFEREKDCFQGSPYE